VTARDRPRFAECAVLFVDLLGVREMNRGLAAGRPIAEGFFVRGALTLGKFHLREGLIFGPALIEAHDLERDVAVYPRIILGADAERSQREDLRYHDFPEGSLQNLLLMRDDEGSTFINYLGVLLDMPEDPLPVLAMHRDIVTARLHEHLGKRSFWEKYRWVAEYHNTVIATRLPPRDAAARGHREHDVAVPGLRVKQLEGDADGRYFFLVFFPTGYFRCAARTQLCRLALLRSRRQAFSAFASFWAFPRMIEPDADKLTQALAG
jgi:hypothetical protein